MDVQQKKTSRKWFIQSKKRVQVSKALWFIVLALQLSSSYAMADTSEMSAQDARAQSSEDFRYDEYYTVALQTKNTGIDLLKFKHVLQKFPLPAEKYDRKKHFGGWIHWTGDQSCLDTRGLVLERESKTDVDIVSCRVAAGKWFDPYTDSDYRSPSDIQIDHVVPLKHAYMTGAYEWVSKKRCQYANYMGNRFHLLAVQGSENMRKGDRGPQEYLPPNQKFTCQYIQIWLQIKYLWSLRLTPKEASNINNIVADERCDTNDFLVSKADIQEQKKIMKETENICVGAALTAF